MLALIYRKIAHWTTGAAFERALDHLNVPYVKVDNNDVHAGKVSLKDFDAAIVVDDGFALKHITLHNLPANSAYYAIDIHYEPDAYLPYLGQFKHIYSVNHTYGVQLVEKAGYHNVQFLPMAWDSLDIPFTEIISFEPVRGIPITFIAAWSTEQRIYLREIVNYKYGGWAKEAYHKQIGDILSKSKIGLNVLGGQGHKTHFGHVNQRTFEVAGCGALLMQQELWNPFTGETLPDLEMCGFKPAQGWFRDADEKHHFWNRKPLQGDENCVTWRDASQLLQTIDYYLDPANEQELTEIAERGRKLVTENHTYIHRVRHVLKDLDYAIPAD